VNYSNDFTSGIWLRPSPVTNHSERAQLTLNQPDNTA